MDNWKKLRGYKGKTTQEWKIYTECAKGGEVWSRKASANSHWVLLLQNKIPWMQMGHIIKFCSVAIFVWEPTKYPTTFFLAVYFKSEMCTTLCILYAGFCSYMLQRCTKWVLVLFLWPKSQGVSNPNRLGQLQTIWPEVADGKIFQNIHLYSYIHVYVFLKR